MRSVRSLPWPPLLSLLLLLLAAAPVASAVEPEFDLLLPWFEIDLEHPGAGPTVSFSLVNASAEPTRARLVVSTDWGIPVLEVTLTLERAEARVVDLGAWISTGELPDRSSRRPGWRTCRRR